MSQAGQLRGLTGITQAERVRFRPYLVSGTERLGAVPDPSGSEVVLDVGIDDLKLALTSELTADLAVNPDFAQTEVDQQRVNLTRFSLFFPEKRQFFIEGGDAMRAGINMLHFGPPPLELFYSRQIGLAGGAPQSILGGGKLTGKAAGLDVGMLYARTNAIEGAAGETFAVGRVRREVMGRSYIGGVVTSREGGGSYNRVLAADANLVIAEHLQVGAMLARSFEPEADGERWVRHAAAQWRDDFLQAGFTVLDISSDFNPGVGFVIRRQRMMGGSFSLRPRPTTDRIRQFEISPSLVYFHDDDGDLRTRRAALRLGTFFESGDQVSLTLTNRVEGARETLPDRTGRNTRRGPLRVELGESATKHVQRPDRSGDTQRRGRQLLDRDQALGVHERQCPTESEPVPAAQLQLKRRRPARGIVHYSSGWAPYERSESHS